MKGFDPLNIPLRGVALIEASAGTGKTYTLTTLYLRLLLERALAVDRILVVTFTEAATEALRDRIRRRLTQAFDWLQQGDLEARRTEDPVLVELLRRLNDRDAARTALADALTRLDEATIHTIHGFCQRVLQDHTLESGAPFDAEFISDETHLRRTAIADFWRRRVSAASREDALFIREHWKTPEALLTALRPTLALDDLRVIPPVDEGVVARARHRLEQVLECLRSQWKARRQEVTDILLTSPALNRNAYNKRAMAKALAAAEVLAAGRGVPTVLPDGFAYLTTSRLAQKTKANQSPPSHPFFTLCEAVADRLPKFCWQRKTLFLQQARDAVRSILDQRKREQRLLYFDDLLRWLDRALGGQGAESLASAIRERYPVALIDEFQDTDPQQYRIFRTVYQGQPACGLFLIGDPKQAIYAFRGADIFTYMQARDDTNAQGLTHTLDVNWRSGSRLVEAINTLFQSVPRPFIYEPQIHFARVKPSAAADRKPLLLDAEEPVPLQFWMLPVTGTNATKKGFIRKDAASAMAARACAERIAELLNLADAGRVRLGERCLRPRDMAVLVRTHREGNIVQQALRDCNVSSVTLSQDSVFNSEEAEELSIVLEALAARTDEGRVRAALATRLLGCSAAELEGLAQDEAAWEAVLDRFQGYHDRWRDRGCMVALQALLVEEGIGGRLRQYPDGERRLTNLLQLVELLQVAAGEQAGIDGLLRWFAEARLAEGPDEARQLRLESDEGLVKVVTLHKSKGLEYPLVFIPFPWSYFDSRRDPSPLFFHDPKDRMACLDLGSDRLAQHRELGSTEQLAERLRLLYVALTRAAKLCVVCWGRVNEADNSAMAYLLHHDPANRVPASRMQTLSEGEIRADLDALAARAPTCISVSDRPPARTIVWNGRAVDPGSLTAASFDGPIDATWRISSYSGLVRDHEAERSEDDAEEAPVGPAEEVGPAEGAEGVFELPRGAQTGEFLHQVFESLDFPEAAGEGLSQVVRRLLGRYGQLLMRQPELAAPLPDWAPVVEALVSNVLDTLLDEAGTLRLRDIALTERLNELEFHYPIARLDASALRGVLSSFDDHQGAGDGLTFEPTRGLMRGFIDLVFRHAGRFYIVDYKSNHLGARLEAYAREGLRQAIQQHRYDLQYLLYTLAVHRFLGQRVASYDYDRHFGGVYYLFLRGMRAAQGPRYGVWHDRPPRRLIESLDGFFGAVRKATP
ncbi:MAG: exodeoxyribonuclease V subunit beta [Gammaproteobacteria bacterium]